SCCLRGNRGRVRAQCQDSALRPSAAYTALIDVILAMKWRRNGKRSISSRPGGVPPRSVPAARANYSDPRSFTRRKGAPELGVGSRERVQIAPDNYGPPARARGEESAGGCRRCAMLLELVWYGSPKPQNDRSKASVHAGQKRCKD